MEIAIKPSAMHLRVQEKNEGEHEPLVAAEEASDAVDSPQWGRATFPHDAASALTELRRIRGERRDLDDAEASLSDLSATAARFSAIFYFGVPRAPAGPGSYGLTEHDRRERNAGAHGIAGYAGQ